MIPWSAIITLLTKIMLYIFEGKVKNDKAKKEFLKFVDFMQSKENISIKLNDESKRMMDELNKDQGKFILIDGTKDDDQMH